MTNARTLVPVCPSGVTTCATASSHLMAGTVRCFMTSARLSSHVYTGAPALSIHLLSHVMIVMKVSLSHCSIFFRIMTGVLKSAYGVFDSVVLGPPSLKITIRIWWRSLVLKVPCSNTACVMDLTKARYSHPVRNGYSGLIRGKDGVGEDEGLHPTSDTAYCVEVGCLTTASLHRHWLNDNLLYMYAIILPGHHGQYCQLWLDECSDSPCQNGGVCVLSYDTGYTCDCEEGKHLYSSVIMIATVYSTRCKVSLAFCVIFARINLWLSLVDRVRRW